MDHSLLAQLRTRLQAAAVGERTQALVLAACAGPQQLASTIESGGVFETEDETAAGDQPSVFLSSIGVEGFRGIGPKALLDLEPGPGLTLVVGRNGSGKSSFAEGLEMLLTGSNLRWEDRAATWKGGWRNLHHQGGASITAEFLLSGTTKPTQVHRYWEHEDGLDDSVEEVQLPDGDIASLAVLEWGPALDNFRPFLSYNELGSMLADRPADLHDAMSAFLGLESLLAAQKLLGKARLDHQQPAKDLKTRSEEVLRRLGETDDPRSALAIDALAARKPDRELIRNLARTGEADVDDAVRALASLPTPAGSELEVAADQLAAAIDAVTGAAVGESGHAARLASLLRSAHNRLEADASTACPVCGTAEVIDDDWRTRTRTQIAELEAMAASVSAANSALQAARRVAQTAIVGVPGVLRLETGVVSAAAARDAWQAWAVAPATDTELVDRLRAFGPVADAVELVRAEADQMIQQRDLGWQPYAQALSAWLDAAEDADVATTTAKEIKAAEDWLKEAIGEIRTQRFAPIVDQSRALWEMLRHQSNVQLDQVALEGANTSRRVSLEVTVDGTPAAALGVMSQGELHALALSLFLPRATMPQSPFRFVVIDDPVQAMDPARVDGLARVLEKVAATHQVVVFTHDDRLPESVLRLGISAQVLEVTRQAGSRVSTRVAWDAVTTAIDDARAVALTETMALTARQKVVPSYCRLAIEAAAATATRRRRLAAGAAHSDVEQAIVEAKSLRDSVALALFDDVSRRSEVNDHLRERCSPGAAWALHVCNSGAHGEFEEDPKPLVNEAERVAKYLLEQA